MSLRVLKRVGRLWKEGEEALDFSRKLFYQKSFQTKNDFRFHSEVKN